MTEQAIGRSQAQIPNALTVFRIVLIPLFVALVLRSDRGWTVTGAVIFGVAGITDQIDGWLARRWHVESALREACRPARRPSDDRRGRDPALASPAGCRSSRSPSSSARDLLLLGGYTFVMERGYDFKVNLIGKAAHLAALRGSSPSSSSPSTARAGRSGSSGRARAGADRRRSSTWGARSRWCWPDEGGRDGRGRGHATAPADLEPAEADGADRRQALHGAHPRAAARARIR